MRILTLGLVVAALACTRSSEPQVMCTMIGCENGLSVVVEDPPAGDYQLVLNAPGEQDRVRDCTANEPCDRGAFFGNFEPETVTVRVVAGTDTLRSVTVSPEWRDNQPNGPDCPPTCRQAVVTIRP